MPGNQLQRKLGLWVSVSIVIGSVIGSGIFMKPAVMAQQIGSPGFLFLVWIVAGTVSLFGAMINAEVGAMLPETGGQYFYFRHMYGHFFAYLYGWSCFIVINTAAISAIAFVFAQFSEFFVQLPRFSPEVESLQWRLPYVGVLFPLANAGVKSVAIALIVIVTYINHKSVKLGGAVQVFFTVIKVVALFLLIGFLFTGNGSFANLTHNPSSFTGVPWYVLTGFIAASSGALAAYDGWNNLGFVAGEIKNPKRNIPLALLAGLGICMLMYLLTTAAYLYIIPIEQMKGSALVAADAMQKVGGIAGGAFISILVMISTAGATNGNAMPSARVIFAMASHHYFFKWTAKVHPKHQTPSNALWLQCAWAVVFVITGSFDMLADLFVFVTWIFYGFGAYGIFILRKKMPQANRPYKLWGYPVVPIVFILFSVLYFVITIYNDVHNYNTGKSPVINSLLGLLLILAGIPLYIYFKRKHLSHGAMDENIIS